METGQNLSNEFDNSKSQLKRRAHTRHSSSFHIRVCDLMLMAASCDPMLMAASLHVHFLICQSIFTYSSGNPCIYRKTGPWICNWIGFLC